MALFSRLILLFPLAALASLEQPVPEDFAWGFPLTTQGRYDIYETELPESLYRSIAGPGLADLRVFDVRGGLVPFILLHDRRNGDPQPKRVAVAFFPLHRARDAKVPAQIRIETSEGGAIVNLRSNPENPPRQTLWGYLVDLGRKNWPVRALELQWEGAGGGFLTRIGIEHSDDLNRWQPLVESATLADLRFDGRRVYRNRVEFPRPPGRYLRLHWPAGEKGGLVTAVNALVAASPPSTPLRWTPLEPYETLAEDGKRHHLYDSRTWFPVVRLRVTFPGNHALATVLIESRPDEDVPWERQYRGLVYRLQRQGSELVSDDIVIPSTPDRYWRLRLLDTLSRSDTPPRLELGWQPHRLRFAASGNPPYLIACGNARMPPLPDSFQRPLRKMLGRLPDTQIGHAQVGERTPLGDPTLLRPDTSLPWRRWLLWSVLLLGVAVVAWMVRSLYREMRRQ